MRSRFASDITTAAANPLDSLHAGHVNQTFYWYYSIEIKSLPHRYLSQIERGSFSRLRNPTLNHLLLTCYRLAGWTETDDYWSRVDCWLTAALFSWTLQSSSCSEERSARNSVYSCAPTFVRLKTRGRFPLLNYSHHFLRYHKSRIAFIYLYPLWIKLWKLHCQ